MKSRREVPIVLFCSVLLFLTTGCQTVSTQSAATMAAAAATIAAVQPAPTTAALPAPSETPVSVVTLTTEATTAGVSGPTPPATICDDFNDGVLDKSRWLLDSDSPGVVVVENGRLNFVARVSAGEPDTVGASITMLPVGLDIRDIGWNATLVSYAGNVPGGVGLEITLQSGRDLSVDVGPGPNGPEVEFWICPTNSCGGAYEEYDHPGGGLFPSGLDIPMRVVDRGEIIDFYVDGFLYLVQLVGDDPIREVKFYLYADPGSEFHVTIDDVCITYVE